MGRIAALKTNFTAGEFSPRLYGRVDVDKYNNACRTIENFVIPAHGGARKRPGFKYITEVKYSDEDARLIPFQYNVEQSYALLFGNGYIWFFRNEGIITHPVVNISTISQASPAVVTTTASHGYSTDDWVYIVGVNGMHQVNNRRFRVVVVTGTTFELHDDTTAVNSGNYDAYTSGGSVGEIVELQTNYTPTDLPDLQYAQTNDVLYITHPDHAPQQITRTSNTAWTIADFEFEKGPFQTINDDTALTVTASSWSAGATTYGTQAVGSTATLTASSALFTSDMVGMLLRVREGGDGRDGGLVETGVSGPNLGSSSSAISNGDQYTTDGYVYGVTNVTTITSWEFITRVPAHKQGTVRVYPSGTAGYFDATYLHDSTCILEVTAFTSSTVVTVQIVHNQMPSSIRTAAVSLFELGSWCAEYGYPSEIAFHENRLWFASTAEEPQTLWASRSGLYVDFEDGAEDTDAIIAVLGSGQADIIRWMSSGQVLTAGTSSSEMSIAPSTRNEALTPSNVRIVPETTFGSSATAPIRIGRVTLFPQRFGDPDNYARKLREYSYNFGQDAYEAIDLTVFSEHITGDGMIELAYQLEPDQIVYAPRNDGYLIGMTYQREQKVIAWHKHLPGGTNSKFLHAATIAGTMGDDLYVITERTIDGTTRRYIEVQAHYPSRELSDVDYKAASYHVDCGLVGASSDAEITGLYFIEGETVNVLNDGAHETHTVTDGKITLDVDPAGATVAVGLPINSHVETLDLEFGAEVGTASARPRNVCTVFMQVEKSLGGTAGHDSAHQTPVVYRFPSDPMDASPPLQTDYLEIEHPWGWDRSPRVRVEHTSPFPFHLTSLVVEMITEDEF
jgi:hypothetical protein